jgi:hypothetical protein
VFLHLKTFLGGRRFHDNEVKEAVNTWLASQVASFYDAGIQKLVPATTSTSTIMATMSKSSVLIRSTWHTSTTTASMVVAGTWGAKLLLLNSVLWMVLGKLSIMHSLTLVRLLLATLF